MAEVRMQMNMAIVAGSYAMDATRRERVPRRALRNCDDR
jgi:hypothetical protein